MSSIHFYRDLPEREVFDQAIDANDHHQAPADWWVVIADVMNSTQAIESGAYKDVNAIGVACISAVLNVDRSIEIPFVFGGDGATFAVPDELRDRVILALRLAQRVSRESFGFSLRVGLVQVSDLLKQGFWIRLAKVRLSSNNSQAVFSGRGWNEADRWIKDRQEQHVLWVHENQGPSNGSFEGFECRWKNVPSFKDHKLTLMVMALSGKEQTGQKTYREEHLNQEWRVRSSQLTIVGRIHSAMRILLLNLAGVYLFAFKKDTKTVQWSRYVKDMIDNSDFQKFDGTLRMVIDGSDTQFLALKTYLDEMHRQGHLAYGIHKSREAMLTCIVSSYNDNHIHFVDGSDGGYAMAAHELKQQLATLYP